MQWKRLFKTHILERGIEYYYEGCVQNLQKNGSKVTATVCGSEDYKVEIVLENDNVADMYCSCPYAESGNNCKHMAAVLYELGEKNEKKASGVKKSTVKDLVINADEKTVRGFLIEVLENNPMLADRFKILSNNIFQEVNIQEYENYMDRIIFQYSDRAGYINYYSAHKFFNDIDTILYTDIDALLGRENFKSAFLVVMCVCEGVSGIDIDDSDGGLTMLASRCEEILDIILANSNNGQKKEYFSILLNKEKKLKDWFISEFFEDIIISKFTEKDFLADKLDFVKEKMEFYKNKEDLSDYYLQKWMITYLDMIPEEEKMSFCQEYWLYPYIRKWFVEKCIEQENYDEAINALKDGIILDKDSLWAVNKHKKKLKDLYKITENYDEYIKLLKEIVLSEGGSDFDSYKELKSLYAQDEWIKIREDILSQVPVQDIDVLYNEEKLYTKLIECVVQGRGLGLVKEYQKSLLKYYPKQIFDKYVSELTHQAQWANNRNMYKALVDELRELKSLPQGKEVADRLASEWKVEYKRRKAMMQELDKL